MALFGIVTVLVFAFFQIKPVMFGPVGIAFHISCAAFLATGVMIMAHDCYRSSSKNGAAEPSSWCYAQVRQFWELPQAWKVIIWMGMPTLPLVVDFITKL